MRNITKGKQIGVFIKPESIKQEIHASEDLLNEVLKDYTLKSEAKTDLSKKADKSELNKYVLKTTYETKIKSLEERISKLESRLSELEKE